MSYEPNNQARVKVGCLYKNTSRAGKEYLAGKLGFTAKLLCLPNPDKREGDNLPDWDVFVVEATPKPDGQRRAPGTPQDRE